MPGPRFEHFEHGADIGVRGFGLSQAEAFAQAALAMTAVVEDPQKIRARERVELTCSAPDSELLLVDWLNAIIFEMATRHMLFGRFDVTVADGRLTGTAYGERIDPDRHDPRVEVKGATYTALEVTQSSGGEWRAQCVVDV